MTRRTRELSASLRRLGRTVSPAGYAFLMALAAIGWAAFLL